MNKEIIFISNFLGNGGAARVITVLAESLYQKGYNVSIIAFPFSGQEYPKSDHITYKILDLGNSNGLASKFKRISLIRRELKKYNQATVISFEYFINMMTVVANIGLKHKLIISERNDPAHKGGNFPNKQLRNILYRKADCLVCQTPDAKAYFPKSIQNKTVVIPNPIKADLPAPWNGKREKEIVNFCRLNPQKNLKLLIDSFGDFSKKFDDYVLKIYGDGNLRDELEDYVLSKNMKDKIMILPAVSDIHERVKKAAMFVSSSDYEGLSNSMLEAMALGIPTICTDCPCGGAAMIIDNEKNGLLVPVGNKAAMIDAMKRVAGDQELASQLSDEGVKIRTQLAADKIVEQWRGVIE